jgi:hypothetical protein
MLTFVPCPLHVPAIATVTMRRPLPVPEALYWAYVVEVSLVSWAARFARASKMDVLRFPGTPDRLSPVETEEGEEFALG